MMQNLLTCLLAVALAILGGRHLMRSYTSRRALRLQSERQAMADAFRAALAGSGDGIAASDNNKLLAGTIKACEAIAIAVGELRGEVGKLSSLLAQPKAAYPEDALLLPASEEEARIAAETFAHILNGVAPEEAGDRARADEEKKTMISAVDLEY